MRKPVFGLYCGILVILLVLLDQLTKYLAILYLKDRADRILLSGVLQLHYLENTGAAFSVLRGQTAVFYVLIPVLCVAILWVFFKLPFEKRFFPVHICCVFLIAGAVGNLIDRVRFGAVTDFIYFSLINFPVFNVADIYVTCSMAVLLVLLLFFYKEEDMERVFGRHG